MHPDCKVTAVRLGSAIESRRMYLLPYYASEPCECVSHLLINPEYKLSIKTALL